MGVWISRLMIVSALFLLALSTGGCSHMHGGLSTGYYNPVPGDLPGSSTYGFDLHVKVNDKWRAGVEVHQIMDLGDSQYLFDKTYSGPSLGPGTAVPATSTISLTTVMYGVQYFLKENLVIDAGFGEAKSQVNNSSSSYSYSPPIGDKVPDGNLFKLTLIYTTKNSIADVLPYVGLSYLHLDANGSLHKTDGTNVVFTSTDAIGLIIGVMI